MLFSALPLCDGRIVRLWIGILLARACDASFPLDKVRAHTHSNFQEPKVPPMWPDRFHVLLITWKNDPTFLPDLDMRGSALGVDDLYYDWPGGNNVIVMRMQHQEGDTVDWACNTGWYTYVLSIVSYRIFLVVFRRALTSLVKLTIVRDGLTHSGNYSQLVEFSRFVEKSVMSTGVLDRVGFDAFARRRRSEIRKQV